MPKFFTNPLKKIVGHVVSAAMLFTSFAPVAQAQSFPCLGVVANTGLDDRCAAVDVGGIPVAYPKLQWTWVSALPVSAGNSSSGIIPKDEAVALGNRAALVLGIKPEQLANSVSVAPANVPYVVARYDNNKALLRIDIFKLEKGMKDGVPRAGVLQAMFTPAHGDHWKANRSYISPDAVKYGLSPGVNPFQAFAQPGDDLFHNISFNSAQVAVGHAMRLVGAPFAVLTVPDVTLTQQKKSKRSGFKKTVTLTTTAHSRTRWFVAQPTDTLGRSTSMTSAAFCVNSDAVGPDGKVTCPSYAMAVAGVSFEEFEGGTFNSDVERQVIDVQKKSGYSFGSFLGAVVGVLALASLGPIGGLGALAIGFTSDSDWKNKTLASNAPVVESTTAMNSAAPTKVLKVGGASLNAQYPEAYNVPLPSRSYAPTAPSNKIAGIVTNMTTSVTTQSFVAGTSPTFKSFSTTILGGCPASALSGQCGTPGIIPRADQYLDSNVARIVRDTQDALVRETR